ncbi:MAG: recombination regulator RecX [Clostridiaceae bacterium]
MRRRYHGVVTKIEVGKRNKNRVNVYLDDEFSFACSAEIIYRFNIKAGENINLQNLEEIVEEDNYIKCKSDSLRFLGKTYKTQKQIYDKLLGKGYDTKTIDRVINFLKEYNFIDDDKYAQMYIKEKIVKEGVNKIKFSLISKGIKEEIINEKINEVDSECQEEAILKLAEKKYNQLMKTENDKRIIYKKIGDYLFRKGYSWDIIKVALNQTLKMDFYD